MIQEHEIVLYQVEDTNICVNVVFKDETFWMTQKAMAELFDVNVPAISKHLSNIFEEGELFKEATVSKMEIVQMEGNRKVKREPEFYNLDAIIAVGYRVNSKKATRFRQWATKTLKDYITKGFVLNDERLKNPKKFGSDYFDELLERIRDIRSSEKRVYLKVRDIFATSVDYDPHCEQADLFFKTVQNKLHYSVHGHTAPELIVERADASKKNMGLTSFKGAKVRKSDITIAKNYLTQEELENLNRIVTMYLDYAEDQAKRHIPMYMNDWENRLDAFLQFTGRSVLDNAGHISREAADKFVNEQYALFDHNRHCLESEDSMELDALPILPKK